MEPISILFDTFITLADRIINLEKTKFQDRKSLFKEIIQPLFEELEPVASNYMDIFRKAKKATNEISLQQLINTIVLVGEEREVKLMARIKVKQMADQIREYIKDEDVITFVMAVEYFFDDTANVNNPSRTYGFLEQLRRIEESAKRTGEISTEEKLFISEFIDFTLANLERSWNDIVRHYGKLKIFSLSMPKFIRKRLAKKSKHQ